MSNMLSSVTKFLSGAAAGAENQEPLNATTTGAQQLDDENIIGDIYAPPSHSSSSKHGSFAKGDFDVAMSQTTTTKENNFASTSKMTIATSVHNYSLTNKGVIS